MAYETPKSATRETFVEPTSSRALHSGTVPATWTQINAPINCDRGGVLFSGVVGDVSISIDGSTTLATISSEVYLPISFPMYVQSPGRPATATVTLINYTLGGSTVRG